MTRIAIASTTSSVFAYSDNNGSTWTQVTGIDPGAGAWTKMAYCNGIYVTVNQSVNIVARSVDGAVWTQHTVTGLAASNCSITADNTAFFIVNSDSNKGYRSTDGITWSEITLPSASSWTWPMSSGNRMVVGSVFDNKIIYSTNSGTSWTQTTVAWLFGSGQSLWTGNKFIAFNADGYSVTSTDGITWTVGGLCNGGFYAGGINGTVIVNKNGSTNTYRFTSNSGTTWSDGTWPVSMDNVVVHNDGQYFIAMDQGTANVYRSADGVTWTTHSLPTVSDWRGIAGPITAPSATVSVSVDLASVASVTTAITQNPTTTITATLGAIPSVLVGLNKQTSLSATLNSVVSVSTEVGIPTFDWITQMPAVQQATFVKFDTTQGGVPITVRMSTHDVPISITESDGNSYLYPAVGALLSVAAITNEIKSSRSDVSVVISGIQMQYMQAILENPIKGSPIEIRRAFFDVKTGQMLMAVGNPVLEFSGVINNFSVDEGWTDENTNTVTMTIALSCSSIMSVLMTKVSGRRTNQADQTYWFDGDLAMNRVNVISDAVFDFGGTTPSATIVTPTGKTVTNTVG